MSDTERLGFWSEQARRFMLRWIVARYAVVSLIFWTASLIAAGWLRHFGFSWMVYLGGSVWLYFALPTIYVHAQLLVDVLGYGVTQKTYFFQALLERTKVSEEDALAEMTPQARALYTKLRFAFKFASFTSPIVAPATWALIVLVRMPSEAHLKSHASREEIQDAILIGRRIELSVTEGWTQRQYASFAA